MVRVLFGVLVSDRMVVIVGMVMVFRIMVDTMVRLIFILVLLWFWFGMI